MGTSLLLESIAREVHTYFKMRTFIVFLALFGAALSSPHRDLDRNIFDDAWNGIQDAGHAIQDAGNAAWNAAATTKDVTELIFRCKDVAIDLVQSVNVGQIKGELQPMLKDGLKNDDIKTIGHLVEGYSDKMHRFGECMSQEGEFKPQDSWWNPFGRAGQFRRMETVSDRGFQLPHAYSLSITGTAAGSLGAGVEVGDEAAALDGSLVFGFWNELGSIPGKSITTGASIATPGIKLGVGVDLVWAVNGSGYLGATISLTAGVDVVDAPFLDVEFSPVVGCYGVCMFGDCHKGSLLEKNIFGFGHLCSLKYPKEDILPPVLHILFVFDCLSKKIGLLI